MVKIKVKNVNFGERTIDVRNGSVKELIKKLDMDDDAVILVGEDGKIYTEDGRIRKNAEINVIEVFSGG